MAERERMAISQGAHAMLFQAELMGIMLAAQARGGRVVLGGTETIWTMLR